MSRFNLLDEPWISVVYDDRGSTKEISLLDLFANAHQYRDLAGDTKTQDFAVLRVLLAVLHTVFSRFDADGEPYDYLELDDKYRQVEEIDENDLTDYEDDLYDTWANLWDRGQFPEIIGQYLEKWRDRFYLFDDKYPFFQVRKEDISEDKINKANATSILGKFINKTISESGKGKNGEKRALFSPKNDDTKSILSVSELVRWLIAFQGYTGTSDKTAFKDGAGSPSDGWIYNIGGIFVKGNNLFQTLMFNCILPYNENDNLSHIQIPCWEVSSTDLILTYLSNDNVNSIASLYTVWSRGIYINSNSDLREPFSFQIVKLPKITSEDNFLEPMTLWSEKKGIYTPKKHEINQSLWRSFGLLNTRNSRKPGIVDWLTDMRDEIGNRSVMFYSVGMQDDGNVTSRVPVDEIIDSFSINEFVMTDLDNDGWVIRINEAVEQTKNVISTTYKKYISEIKEIRNVSSSSFVSQKVEEMYFKVDHPFRQWLSNIQIEDEKDAKIREWRGILKSLVIREAEAILKQGGTRDYLGVSEGKQIKNIATAYNTFNYWINQTLK
ncbi:type I-E CRISPR-associated protein Cse1/CasA [Streptococcus mutans]|nr:type I-E CRISPR-associated protein Cse1/CasA [Streptococcus mutans]MCB5082604.1 type I-E CRISPR-associated protein Cse1/CasA [Streptococcus mutans]MCB5085595.1 type I-E CRISPR-associated protein Cse1/CasA [Streptococcus mutans]MCB5086426.1 type I-E CRISPR-associated protein Cse1/CasA [Streptococcus mutans]